MELKILLNAHIYTLDPTCPQATALAIYQDRILAVGSDQEIIRSYGEKAKKENLEGQIIIPGLTDAHIHFKNYALSLQKIDCETATRQECIQRVADRVKVSSPGEWILGHGWTQNEWAEGFGDAALLDEVAPNNPVYLTAKSLHAGWANTVALKIARINTNTPDPVNGHIQRNTDSEPTGILFETAMQLVSEAIPAPNQAQIQEAMVTAQEALWKMGITGIHDFDRRDCFVALQSLHQEEKLKLRVTKSIPVEQLNFALELGLRTGFGDQFLKIGMVKAFADGALGPHTAAMFQPYNEDLSNSGILMLDAEEIYDYGQRAVSNGLGLTIHAIGDRANHEVLDAYTQLRQFEIRQGLPHHRHRIEHVQILHPDDYPRLANLDVIASMQPIHATSDMVAADRFWGARARHSYAWNTLLDQGTHLAFGSDAPVDSPNPFWGLHAAVTRRRANGDPSPEGWYPDQKLSRQQALSAYTAGPAYAAYMENDLGKLRQGYLADLLVLDKNYFTCIEEDIRNILPIRTMVGGSWVI